MILNNEYDDGIFNLSKNNKKGFLTKFHPLRFLPNEFFNLQEILIKMPIWLDKEKKINGYLYYSGKIKKVVENNLPNYENTILNLNKNEDNYFRLIQALFRSYTFLASAYLLEPAHHNYLKYKEYGKANNVLPKNISVPLVLLSEILNVHPFLDYHYSYSLGNYYLINENKPIEYQNLGMINSFSGTKDEIGFSMIHVDIDSHSYDILKSIRMILKGLNEKNRFNIISGLQINYEALVKINERRMCMWKASNYKNFNDFRIFIMGITGNEEIFGEGVIYEGVEKYNNKPQQFIGPSGAQDDIIPSLDILTGIVQFYPDNELTQYLIRLREYKPKITQDFMKDLEIDCRNNFEKFLENGNEVLISLLKILQQIYIFRNGHWMFVQKYIMSNTKYGKASGGTPIKSWLHNQIEAVLMYMKKVIDNIKNSENEEFILISKNHKRYCTILKNQLQELKKIDYNLEAIYLMNEEFKEYID